MVGEDIRSNKEAAWDMDDLQIEIFKVKQPLDLMVVEVLGLTEVRQVLVIHKDLDGEGGTMEIMSPRLQGTNDGKEFSVIDVIISFCSDEQLREV